MSGRASFCSHLPGSKLITGGRNAAIGGELRTPLANLKAELDLALRRSRTREELMAALGSASEETNRLARLAEDLLALARAERGRLPVRRENLDMASLLRNVVSAFSLRAKERGVSIEPASRKA